MGDVAAAVGLLGAGACLAERLDGPARGWVPHAVVLAVMALTAYGAGGAVLATGACALAAAGAWTALAGRCTGRASAAVDLAAMALLTAAVGRHSGTGGMPGMRTPAGIWFFLFLLACWLLARAAVHLAVLVGAAPDGTPTPTPVRPGGRAALRTAGSAAMIASMAAMLA